MGTLIQLPGRDINRAVFSAGTGMDWKFHYDAVDLGYIKGKLAVLARNHSKRGGLVPDSKFLGEALGLLRSSISGVVGGSESISGGYLKFTTTGDSGTYRYEIRLSGAWWL